MRIAVLTMTRDRVDYSAHCYASLLVNAGTDFDWFVVDQGSQDETQAWLGSTDATIIPLEDNIGICPALNLMLDQAFDPEDYDVIVRWDNDCELLTPNTLRDVCEAADDFGWILSPLVLGLRNQPAMTGTFRLGDKVVRETSILGGIFMAIPSDLFTDLDYRYDETNPPYAGDEAICGWWREQGGHCGYLTDYQVNHYLTTDGQHHDIPDYFARSVMEGAPA